MLGRAAESQRATARSELGPVAGDVWDPLVDHATFEPAATVDFLAISLNELEVDLGAPGTLLCSLPPLLLEVGAAPGSPFAVSIPNDAGLLGREFCAQAASTTDGVQFALTNALDVTIGNQ